MGKYSVAELVENVQDLRNDIYDFKKALEKLGHDNEETARKDKRLPVQILLQSLDTYTARLDELLFTMVEISSEQKPKEEKEWWEL